MQLKYVLVIALAAALAVALVAEASSESASPSKYDWKSFKSRPHRYGHWRFRRLHQKFGEFHSDVGEAKAELKVAKAWAKRVCFLTNKILDKKISRARASVRKWHLIVQLRKAQLAFHSARHTHHRAHWRYIRKGPKARRAFLKSCTKGHKACAKEWKKKNFASWERWHEARAEYHKAHHKRKLDQHRVHRRQAKARLARARKHRKHAKAVVKKLQDKRESVNKRCRTRTGKRVHRFAKYLAATRRWRHRTWGQALRTRDHRAAREKKHEMWVMNSCKPLNGGKFGRQQHAYRCLLNLHEQPTGKYKFHHCKRLREVRPGVTKYKCRK